MTKQRGIEAESGAGHTHSVLSPQSSLVEQSQNHLSENYSGHEEDEAVDSVLYLRQIPLQVVQTLLNSCSEGSVLSGPVGAPPLLQARQTPIQLIGHVLLPSVTPGLRTQDGVSARPRLSPQSSSKRLPSCLTASPMRRISSC